MPLIIIELIIFGWVVAGYTWYKLETFEKKTKIIYIIFGFVICYLITFMICNMASIGVEFKQAEIKGTIVQNLSLVFTPINSIILMPYIAGTISMYNSNQIEKKDALKRLTKIVIIFFIIAILEFIFLKNIESGTIQYMNNLKS